MNMDQGRRHSDGTGGAAVPLPFSRANFFHRKIGADGKSDKKCDKEEDVQPKSDVPHTSSSMYFFL